MGGREEQNCSCSADAESGRRGVCPPKEGFQSRSLTSGLAFTWSLALTGSHSFQGGCPPGALRLAGSLTYTGVCRARGLAAAE